MARMFLRKLIRNPNGASAYGALLPFVPLIAFEILRFLADVIPPTVAIRLMQFEAPSVVDYRSEPFE